jgi:Peptidase propeptide and YPEB domain
MPRLPMAILALVSLGLGAQALGQTTTAVPTAASQPSGPALAIPDLVERLTRDGYRDFREIERKGDKLYKVDARDAQGRNLELSVDARTAEVLASEEDDDN